jgi:hypothetical protein
MKNVALSRRVLSCVLELFVDFVPRQIVDGSLAHVDRYALDASSIVQKDESLTGRRLMFIDAP